MARIAGLAGIAAFVVFTAGWVAGDLAQPAAFSPARDDISDLGALTASDPWLYNQVAANAGGLLVVLLGVGLWQVLTPSRLGRFGAGAVILAGTGAFLDGLFRLDCQGIDVGCRNDSWHSHAHKIESGVTVAATFAAFVLLAIALRRRPIIAAIPAIFAANILFSGLGAGAATRAGTVVLFAAFAWLGFYVLRSRRGTSA